MATSVEVFPPGDFVREELGARDWTQSDLADIMGRPVEAINRIVTGKLGVTPETARGLASAFGTSPEVWLNLESAYRLSHVKEEHNDVARRARLFDVAPIKDMVRRGWIESSSNVDVMENQIVRFYELKNISQEPCIAAAARKSMTAPEATSAQRAWYFRIKHLASTMDVKPYTKKGLELALGKLRNLAEHPQELRHVPRILADAGVRFLVVEHLPKSKMDGATLWLSKRRPVVALSLRYDRIDCFWHTLAHELGHVLHGDALSLDNDIVGETEETRSGKPEYERRADEFASHFLVPREELQNFIVRIRPLYAKKKIYAFATRIGVHPGIVVGQLQHRKEIGYSHSRDMLVKVRDVVTSAAVTDGWGIKVIV
jgi:HTH-type transcriptional regulator/antitoxin HigA